MKLLCLFIPHLPVQWECRKHPELARAALIIGGFPYERKTVLDCSEKAAASGVSPGMTLRQASHRCPDAVFLPVDEAGYARAFDEVLDILDQFSPVVEADSPGRAFLDVSGTEQLFGPAENLAEQVSRDVLRQTGLPVPDRRSRQQVRGRHSRVAGFHQPADSEQAARRRRFLAPLSVEFLPISPEAITWLKRLGLRTMGQVAGLPVNALDSQLGREGLMAHRLANGIDERAGDPQTQAGYAGGDAVFRATLGESGRPAGCSRQAAGPTRAPAEKALPGLRPDKAAASAPTTVRAWPDTVNLKTPLDSKPEMLGILKRHLETASFPEGVSEIHLGLAKLGGESGKQAPLSSGTKGRQEEALQRLEKDLGDRFGHSPLKRVVELDPDSRIPERRVALVDAHADG